MKQHLLFLAIILFSNLSLSQTVYKVDVQRFYSWDNVSNPADWKQDLTQQYTYGNEGNKETKLLALEFPSANKTYQINKTYNASNNITLEVMQFWNSVTMVWLNTSQTLYSYDVANNLTEEISQNYNQVTMAWSNSSRVLYNYSGANAISETEQLWDIASSNWINSSRTLYAYSGSDITEYTEQNWNTATSSWSNVEKTEITYAAPEKPIQAIQSEWNIDTNMWEVEERDTATYNGMDLIEEVLTELYDGSTWEPAGKIFFTYTAGGLETEVLYQDWDGSNWVNEDRDSSVYDTNGNKTAYIFESWSSVNMAWEPYYKEEKDFSVALPFSLDTESFVNERFKVFPNPASDIINITASTHIEKVELFDIVGKKVLSTSNIEQINVEYLKSGMYLLKAFSNNRSATKRIVIK